MMKQVQNGHEQMSRQIRCLPANPELKEMAIRSEWLLRNNLLNKFPEELTRLINSSGK